MKIGVIVFVIPQSLMQKFKESMKSATCLVKWGRMEPISLLLQGASDDNCLKATYFLTFLNKPKNNGTEKNVKT